MNGKRVFVLGAGFSKQADMPLATEFTSLILNGERLKKLEEMRAWLDDFTQRLETLQSKDNGGSISRL